MAIAILTGRDESEQKQHEWFSQSWRDALLALNPDLDIRIWPDIGNPADIEFLLVWKHPIGVLGQFKQAKAIQSLGAGVDHIFVDPNISTGIPIARIIDSYMASDIVQYVTAYALQHIKLVKRWAEKQQQQKWNKEPPFNLSEKMIGIMGMGFLGSKAAHVLSELDLNVSGWSQSEKNIPGIKHFTGDAEFSDFLSQSDMLICMLPLTDKTENILNSKTLSQLPKDAYLINVGRGSHLVEEDLLTALDSNHLSGACLDVFRQEPLPVEHPFWSHPKIQVTPHIASVTNPYTAAPQVYENYSRMLSGQALLRQIDAKKGY
jgi:glyoxylate/hydroxypyruvate reductase A